MCTRRVLATAVLVCAAAGYLPFAEGDTVVVAQPQGTAEQQLVQMSATGARQYSRRTPRCSDAFSRTITPASRGEVRPNQRLTPWRA
jgi:hypothetical protein